MKESSINNQTAIEQWRTALFQSGKFSIDELDELECHMQDELESLTSMGISEEEKFLVASHRIGSEKELSKAYDKPRLFSFIRFSMFGQIVLMIITFLQLNRLGNAILTSLSIQDSLSDELLLVTFFVQQIIGLAIVALLLRAVLKLSLREEKLVKANVISMISAVFSFLALMVYSYFTPYAGVLPRPVLVYMLPNSIYIILIISFMFATLKNWKRNRLALKAS